MTIKRLAILLLAVSVGFAILALLTLSQQLQIIQLRKDLREFQAHQSDFDNTVTEFIQAQ